MSTVAQSEIARYVEAVRAALADLPQRDRDDLLEDLPDHLAEVWAEGQGSLESRLGPPEVYAAELRASAGLGGGPGRERLAERVSTIATAVRRRLRQADVRLGPVLGYATAGEFLRQLRPAWWVLRGYVAAMVVVWILEGNWGELGLLPRLGGSDAAALVILAGFVVGSIWLGRRSTRFRRWPRRLVLAGSALVVLFALVLFVEADQRARWGGQEYATVYSNPYQDIADVFAYDSEGRLLTNVRLFDQNGQPIQLGYMDCAWQPDGPRWGNVAPYPRCPENAPFGARPTPASPADPAPAPAPSPAPSLSPAPAPSFVPSPSALPNGAVSPSPSGGSSVTPGR